MYINNCTAPFLYVHFTLGTIRGTSNLRVGSGGKVSLSFYLVKVVICDKSGATITDVVKVG